MSSNITTQYQLLSATYDSPTNAPFSQTQKLPSPASTATSERVAYLGNLRKATAELQEHINKELTQRMAEDQSRQATDAAAKGKTSRVVDEGKEEENYGEEVPED
jgi:hypothetical protein